MQRENKINKSIYLFVFQSIFRGPTLVHVSFVSFPFLMFQWGATMDPTDVNQIWNYISKQNKSYFKFLGFLRTFDSQTELEHTYVRFEVFEEFL